MGKKRDTSHFSLIDWDFKTEDSRAFLHNFCWYPARFIPIIPAHLIQALSHPNDTVLDPFCGSGTTIIESLKLRRNAIGIDINPIACFITRTKADILKREGVNIIKLKEFIAQLSSIELKWKQHNEQGLFDISKGVPFEDIKDNQIPNYEENSKWYEPTTLKMLGYIYKLLERLSPEPTKNICKLFFISILIPSSGHENRKPYTYFADNVRPKTKKFKNAISLFLQKLNKFIFEFNEYKEVKPFPNVKIINSDIKNIRNLFKDREKVDLTVTSPPYLNVTDYTTAYRLVYLWDYFSENIDDIKHREIGARWRRNYAGSFEDYIKALKISIEDMVAVLREKGYLCLILGEPKKHHKTIRNIINSFVVNDLGLEIIGTFSRNLSKKSFMPPIGGVISEEILIFRKGG